MAYLQQHLILVFWASEARKVVLLGCACSIWQHIQLRLLSLMHYFGGKLPSTVVGDTVLYNWVYSRQTFFPQGYHSRMIFTTNYGCLVRKSPSIHDWKSTPTLKLFGTTQFFRFLWFMPSLGVRSPWFAPCLPES